VLPTGEINPIPVTTIRSAGCAAIIWTDNLLVPRPSEKAPIKELFASATHTTRKAASIFACSGSVRSTSLFSKNPKKRKKRVYMQMRGPGTLTHLNTTRARAERQANHLFGA